MSEYVLLTIFGLGLALIYTDLQVIYPSLDGSAALLLPCWASSGAPELRGCLSSSCLPRSVSFGLRWDPITSAAARLLLMFATDVLTPPVPKHDVRLFFLSRESHSNKLALFNLIADVRQTLKHWNVSSIITDCLIKFQGEVEMDVLFKNMISVRKYKTN